MPTGQLAMIWDAPDKGDWRGLHDHFTRPLTPEYRRLLATGMETGEAESFARYGIPARTLLCRFVNGRVFIAAAPLVGPPSATVPPAPLLWLACRLVPAFRRRNAAARRALTERRWLREAADWYETERPTWQARGAALEAVEPERLSDTELAEHLREVQRTADEGHTVHFRLHGPDLLPLGLLLARGDDWGIDAPSLLGLLAGASPSSARSDELPAWRLVTGYDLDSSCAAELDAIAALPTPTAKAVEGDAAAVRERVPADQRNEFDQLVADARAVCDVRDDNGIWTAAWPAGLLRRVMLEVGHRLTERGQLLEPSHAVEMTVTELLELLAGEAQAPSAAEVAERRRRRLAPPPPPPPALGRPAVLPMRALPPAMRTMVGALLAVRDHGSGTTTGRPPLTGEGIGTESVIGRAVVTHDLGDALERFQPGDVLVVRGTTPAYNVVLGCAAAVVTEEGGQLSHAAVIAREFGVPAVIGAAEALARIPDGSLVEVDPAEGRIRVLDDSPRR